MWRFGLLVLACVPLAVLLYKDIRELLNQRAPLLQPVARATSQQRESAQAAVDALARANFDDPAPIEALSDRGASGGFKAVSESWNRWVATWEWIGRYLAEEQAKPGMDVASLTAARKRLDELRAQLEAARANGAGPMLAFLEGRAAAVSAEIDRAEGREAAERDRARIEGEAKRVVAACRAAMQKERYEDAEREAERFLAQHHSITPDAEFLREIQSLAERARFHQDRLETTRAYKSARTPSKREAALEAFVERWSDAPLLSEAEQTMLKNCLRRLEDPRARRALQKLQAAPPMGLDARLEAAGQILERNVGTETRLAVRKVVLRWLEEEVPEKTFAEDPELQEVETVDGEIVRGYFREVRTLDGEPGYKRYDSLEQLRNPVGAVGTYRLAELRGKPSRTMPRLAVTRYNETRARVFRDVAEKQLWTQLADLCSTLQEELTAYYAKPGSSPQVLSFEAEKASLQVILASKTWEKIAVIWGK